MKSLNILKSIASVFSAIGTIANVVERNANSLDNLSKLGENYTANLVQEQDILQKKRLKDLEAKAAKKYEDEKKEWSI